MTEATCASVTANLFNVSSVAAQLIIATTAPHQIGADRRASMGPFGFGIVAGVFLFAIPFSGSFSKSGIRRRMLPLALLLLGGVALTVSCGGGSNASPPPPQIDPGTPAGTYTVNVTAISSGITRTGSFTVTVQ
jgi:hypothetical protein